MQWGGLVYKHRIDEIIVKAGSGLTFASFAYFEAPYFFASIQQKLVDQTFIFIEMWQPTYKRLSNIGKPFFQVGLSLELN
jgi:hypothetical protein